MLSSSASEAGRHCGPMRDIHYRILRPDPSKQQRHPGRKKSFTQENFSCQPTSDKAQAKNSLTNASTGPHKHGEKRPRLEPDRPIFSSKPLISIRSALHCQSPPCAGFLLSSTRSPRSKVKIRAAPSGFSGNRRRLKLIEKWS